MFKFMATLAVMSALVFAPSALADSPHYVHGISDSLSGSSLSSSFKIAGLGDNVTVAVTLQADASAQFACFNGGGKHPQATNKEVVGGPVSATGDFTSSKNGSVTGSLTVDAPGAGDFTCPPGQRLVLTYVAFTNVQLVSVAGTLDLPDRTFGALV